MTELTIALAKGRLLTPSLETAGESLGYDVREAARFASTGDRLRTARAFSLPKRVTRPSTSSTARRTRVSWGIGRAARERGVNVYEPLRAWDTARVGWWWQADAGLARTQNGKCSTGLRVATQYPRVTRQNILPRAVSPQKSSRSMARLNLRRASAWRI
jgi:hypothetical protein